MHYIRQAVAPRGLASKSAGGSSESRNWRLFRRPIARAAPASRSGDITIDSDGQHDPAFAPAIVAALDRADIAIGTRDLSGQAVPKHRRIANMISSAATRAVSGGKVRDSQSGYRAFKAEVLRKVDAIGDRYEYETDFIIRAARSGFTTVNVPISTIYGSPSYFREFRDAWLVIKVLWRHRAGIFKR